jgi:nucleotide-binding universal stress UspA family protein
MSHQFVAVALDFSQGSRAAFAEALTQARRRQAGLLLIHVIPPLATPSPLLDDMNVTSLSLDLRKSLDQSARERIRADYLPQAQDLPTEVLVLQGDPARELVRVCKERAVEVLFVGSTGLSGLAETIFGSVAAKVVRKAHCSVMVVRGPVDPEL